MLGEAQLNDVWFPSRNQSVNAQLTLCTIIYSEQASLQNIIGVDVVVPSSRARLVQPSKDTKSENKPYGLSGLDGMKLHRRRVSALPEDNAMLPIDPRKVYPGISEDQIDLLDHSVGKLMQRCGKTNVTWVTLTEYEKLGAKIFKQEVDDGTSRYQAIFDIPLSLQSARRLLLRPASSTLHLSSAKLSTKVLQRWGANMFCVQQKERHTGGMSTQKDNPPREGIMYWWHIDIEDTIYSTFVSMEPDDELGYAKVDPESRNIRMTYNPGCGYVLTKLDDNKTQVNYLVHFDIGGCFPRYVIDNIIQRNFYKNIRGLFMRAKLEG